MGEFGFRWKKVMHMALVCILYTSSIKLCIYINASCDVKDELSILKY